MNLRELKDPATGIVGDHVLSELADAEHATGARIVLEAARVLRDIEEYHLHRQPERSDTDLKRDIVYRLGRMSAFRDVMNLPRDAAHEREKAQ